ncbi:hypothetical protein GGR53DRAFT_504699 [Hypoxylon sp. FL1150]|nr:hypothetical protein GGR53DRAFT_504699 [Hypoxylon sp. FL1150]
MITCTLEQGRLLVARKLKLASHICLLMMTMMNSGASCAQLDVTQCNELPRQWQLAHIRIYGENCNRYKVTSRRAHR